MYPQSEIANINAATAALSRNELVSAERYLDMVNSNKNLPEYNNAMGDVYKRQIYHFGNLIIGQDVIGYISSDSCNYCVYFFHSFYLVLVN